MCTTLEDWEAIQEKPIFKLLKTYLKPEFMELPPKQPDEPNTHVMRRGHKLLTERAYADGAYFLFTTPDLIFADGYVAEVQRLAQAGERMVLVPTGRYDTEGVVGELQDKGIMRTDTPITVTSRELVASGLRNMHSCLIAADWDSPYFWDFPVYCYWRKKGPKAFTESISAPWAVMGVWNQEEILKSCGLSRSDYYAGSITGRCPGLPRLICGLSSWPFWAIEWSRQESSGV